MSEKQPDVEQSTEQPAKQEQCEEEQSIEQSPKDKQCTNEQPKEEQSSEQTTEKSNKDEQYSEEQATEEQLAEWKCSFDIMADVDGFITKDDLEKCLQKSNKNPTESDMNRLVSCIDTDGDKKIGFKEFVKIQQEASKMTFYSSDIQLELEKALEVFDEDGDGTISKTELKTILDYDDEALQSVIECADTNNDGKLSIKELAAYLTKTAG